MDIDDVENLEPPPSVDVKPQDQPKCEQSPLSREAAALLPRPLVSNEESVPSSVTSSPNPKRLKVDTPPVDCWGGGDCSTDANLDCSFSAADLAGILELEQMMTADFALLEEDLAAEEHENARAVSSELGDIPLCRLQRCTVLAVREEAWDLKELLLALVSDPCKQSKCFLLGDWGAETRVSVGDVVNVRAVALPLGWAVQEGGQSLLVVNPDLLVNVTTVVSGAKCPRAGVLDLLFRGTKRGDQKGIMLLGKILHALAQDCITEGVRDLRRITERFHAMLREKTVIRELATIGLTEASITSQVQDHLVAIRKFQEQYMSVVPMVPVDPGSWLGRVQQVTDIEDLILCPSLGLKGSIDFSARVQDHKSEKVQEIPFEIKSGGSNDGAAHLAQASLYCEMLRHVEGRAVDKAVLWYLRPGRAHGGRCDRDMELKAVPRRPGDDAASLRMRNEFAHYLRGLHEQERGEGVAKLVLPPPITRSRTCRLCAHQEICAAVGSDTEWGERMPQPMILADPRMRASHVAYFLHWVGLVLLEEPALDTTSRLWTSRPEERESEGLGCLSELQAVSCTRRPGDGWLLVLRRAIGSSRPALRWDSLAPGTVLTVGNASRIILGYGVVSAAGTNQEGQLAMACHKDLVRRWGNRERYHVDVYASSSPAAQKLCSLGRLLNIDSPRADEMRRLVIDREEPRFGELSTTEEEALSSPEVQQLLASLNEGQQNAVRSALSARDYLLVRGLPGSGKTETITRLVLVLWRLGRSVLLASHTNMAVDNVLLRLLPHGVPLLRLGRRAHPSLQHCMEAALLESSQDLAAFNQEIMARKVVGTTCAGSADAILQSRHFDVAIIDEATQVLQPATFCSLLAARTFVLFGDPQQLTPIVKNERAVELGLTESLFERLEGVPGAVVTLGQQYRMNRRLCELANHVTYSGALSCGSEQVAAATLQLQLEAEAPAWLCRALDPSMPAAAVFLDVGKSGQAAPQTQGRGCQRQAAVVVQIIQALHKGGSALREVGVMSVYRAQAEYLSSLLAPQYGSELEVSTVDQFQGRDKQVCVVSCARARQVPSPLAPAAPTPLSAAAAPSEPRRSILNDLRRLTVAVTRARVKLVVVGNRCKLEGNPPFLKLFAGLGEENIIHVEPESLPPPPNGAVSK